MKTWMLIRKDLVILLSDRKALAILILMPIILMTILGMGLSSSFEVGNAVQPFTVGIVKEYEVISVEEALSSLPFAQEMEIDPDSIDLDIEAIIFEDILGSEEIQEIFDYRLFTREEGIQALETGEISNLVIFPKDFYMDTLINLLTPFRNEVTLEILVDPDRGLDAQITRAVFGGFEGYLNQVVTLKTVYMDLALKSGLGYAAMDNLETLFQTLQDNEATASQVSVKGIDARRTVNSVEYYAMAMLSMFILFTGGQGGRMLLEEKDQFTLQRMQLSGVGRWRIFFGKYVTVFVVGVIQVSVMIAYTAFVLKVDWGNPMRLAVISLCALLAVAGMGMMIGTLTLRLGNYKVANMMESFIFQVMAFIGGSFMPLEVLPDFFERISYLTINGLALRGYLFNMQGYGLEEITVSLAVLLSMAAVFTGIGLLLMQDEKRWRRVEYHQTQNA